MSQILELFEDKTQFKFSNHTRISKKLLYKIRNSRGEDKHKKLHKKLINTCKKTVKYSDNMLKQLSDLKPSIEEDNEKLVKLIDKLENFNKLSKIVIDQAFRRIVNGEKVPSSEKIFSIYEDHTDIIVKGLRDVVFGHKLFVSTGKSGLILQSDLLKGNPADSSLIDSFIKTQKELLEEFPK